MTPLRPYQFSTERFASGVQITVTAYSVRNTRDLRTLLLEAAYRLLQDPSVTSVQISLVNCKLANKTVNAEWTQFRAALTPRIAKQLILQRVDTQKDQVQLDLSASVRPSKANQEAVLTYLLQSWWANESGATVEQLAYATGASVPTVYKVLNDFEHCLAIDPESKARSLERFDRRDWSNYLQRNSKLRSVYFIDASGMPRSTMRLAKLLQRLQRDDLAIGGVMGALHHIPDLDITASPMLDVMVHGTPSADLSFVQVIDPALKIHRGRPDTANLVVHFVNRPNSLFTKSAGQQWGSLPDCIAHMYKAGLQHQVDDAIRHFSQR